MWDKGFILLPDTTTVHSVLSVNQFLAERRIAVHDHPRYSPELAIDRSLNTISQDRLIYHYVSSFYYP